MQPTILGICGKMGVGKSTAVARILEKHGQPGPGMPVALRFAKGVYAAAEAVFRSAGMTFDKEKARGLLQFIGTDWGRKHYGEDFWIKKWQAEAREMLLRRQIVLVEDVRFDNEAEAIRAMGGKIVHIVGKDTNKGVARDGIKGHASEGGISPHLIDVEISNLSTERAFLAKVDRLWSDFLEGWL